MTDFFDRLEAELTAAAEREMVAGTASTRRRAPAIRPLLVALIGLVLAGTATAAVVTLTGTEGSQPLRGTHTSPARPGTPPTSPSLAAFCDKNAGACPGSGPSTTHYELALLPFAPHPSPSPRARARTADAGLVGWCATATLGDAHSAGGAYGCAPALAPSASARIAGAGFGTGAGRVSFVIVDERVAAVRLRDGRRIRPRTDRSLPAPWRAAVWSGGFDTATTVDLLDADGETLPKQGRASDGLSRVQRAGPVGAARDRRCAINSAALAVHDARTIIDAPRASPDLAGKPFLICGTAIIGNGAEMLQAFVLVDARAPGRPPADLPGAAPLPAMPGVVEVGGEASARRVGAAWLVVTSQPVGGDARSTDRADARRRALAALRVGG
jgi:hypothetical protein